MLDLLSYSREHAIVRVASRERLERDQSRRPRVLRILENLRQETCIGKGGVFGGERFENLGRRTLAAQRQRAERPRWDVRGGFARRLRDQNARAEQLVGRLEPRR
jgi:hypothetical protein